MSESEEIKHASSQSYWANVKKQFRKNRTAVYSLRFILCLVVIAVFADLIANEKPLIAKYKGDIYFPVFKSYAVDMGLGQYPKDFQNVAWKDMPFDFAIFPLIPYLPKNIDYANAHSVSPLGSQDVKSLHWRHWLGTDELGHDMMAGMIHGTRIALSVGLVSMSIAAMIGIFLGAIAGYFGDNRLKVSRIRVILNILFFFLAGFAGFGARSYILSDALGVSMGKFFFELLISMLIFAATMYLANLLTKVLKKVPYFAKQIFIPVDIIVSRMIEIMVSIPTLFLIISIIAIAKPSLFIVMAIIGLTGWTGIARFIRAELLKVRNLEYIEAAHALGYSESRTLLKHAIPNSLSPVLISIAFGIASAILVESTLSFLGIGVPAETMTWGSMLSSARQSPSAWWLAIFPGFAIFITVTWYNLVGEGLTDALDPRLKK
jgi:peptide/nickel transport system permease protein